MSQHTGHDPHNTHDAHETHDAYDASLEILDNGSCRAQLIEMPGCFAIGDDVPATLAALEARIPAYYDWLRAHDEYTPIVQGPFPVRAHETQRVGEQYPHGAEAFFASDARPVSDEDIDWLLALLEWSLDDLLAAGERIPPAARNLPTRASFPPNELLRQAAEMQARYLLMLSAQPNQPDPTAMKLPDTSPLEQLREVREVSLRRLRNVSEQDRGRVFEVMGERWSLRKILRCGILSARMYADALTDAATE
jgi:hypothetical protein